MFKVINDKNNYLNVLHFQGNNKNILPKTFKLIYDNIYLNPIDKDLSIVSCWTDDSKCCLYNQLNKFNINLINALPNDYNFSSQWNMINKIKYYIDCLENKVHTKYVMLLDGYDVLFVSTDNILEKFLSMNYKIIFNTSRNNYPDETIDYIENRFELDFFCYFNAGCCIGYKNDVLKFYKECLNYINIYNPFNSEQKVIRTCFANYSNNKHQRFVWLDFDRRIFQTMAYTKCNYNAKTKLLTIVENYDSI